ncbi:oligosaccharide flippase family protein [Aliarcobacter cryaerophilus]|uniref:lipopolysaccharide biosynthesis protein n=1 Tax=Aliarcobacter cryaerophilus TaxID=28198 RepID=UPI0021B1EB98|nr:oligosaccharide flippase family protein [Aliarcobacter cryaerophilus]MCT7506065.1 oligosaccharide flippase family protein [Aliarcobacter cryaerophilus]
MINKYKSRSEFSRNVLTLMTGTTIAQAIPIAISPILTRIYAPEDFGVFALFIAITAIFGTIANARYELAIMLPKKDEDAINIFALGFIITCFISLILLILVVIFNSYFTKLLGKEEISFWLYFVPITVFFSGLFNILNYFNNRKKNYKDLRNATILKSIILAIIQLSVGFVKAGASGLISGIIISNMFANLKLIRNILKNKILISKISKVKIIALAKRYKDFPKHSMIPSLFDNLSLQLPSLIIPKIFTYSISGYFFFANRIVNLPVSLISASIAQVYLQKISENKNKGIETFSIFINTIKKLFSIALPITIIGYIISPYIFTLLFGEEWRISGEIAQYLFLIFLIRFCVSPMSSSFIPAMELKKAAFWQYLYFISSILLFIISFYLELELKVFLLFYVVHEYVLYGIYMYLIILSVKKIDINIKENN